MLEEFSISVPEMAEETGIPKDRVYKWKQQGTTPKADDERKVIEWMKLKKMDKNPSNSSKTSTVLETDDDLKTLINSNATLAQALLGCREDQKELIQMLKAEREYSRPIERVPQQKELMHQMQVSRILRVLAEVGTGKRWNSVEEAYAELNIILADPLGENLKAHSVAKTGR